LHERGYELSTVLQFLPTGRSATKRISHQQPSSGSLSMNLSRTLTYTSLALAFLVAAVTPPPSRSRWVAAPSSKSVSRAKARVCRPGSSPAVGSAEGRFLLRSAAPMPTVRWLAWATSAPILRRCACVRARRCASPAAPPTASVAKASAVPPITAAKPSPVSSASDCPTDFRCDSGKCARKPCTTSRDCSGYCVNTACHSTPGTCNLPRP
jgi:hypothetical protein